MKCPIFKIDSICVKQDCRHYDCANDECRYDAKENFKNIYNTLEKKEKKDVVQTD